MIPSLNGLRALAIFLVLLAHLSLVRSTPVPLADALRHLGNGELGVRLFFVISGFLITWLLLKEKEKNGSVNLRRFYIRRFLRIFPVFYFYLAFVFLIGKFTGWEVDRTVLLGSLLYLQNFYFWGSDWLVAHSWSLAVEEQFYILWPWLFRRMRNGWKYALPVAVFLAGSVARMVAYKYPGIANYLLLPFLRHVDFLLGGCYLAFFRFYRGDDLKAYVQRVSGWLVFAGMVLVVVLGHLETHPRLDKVFLPVGGTITSLYFMLLIAWVTDPTNAGSLAYRLLNLRWVNQVGILSYSLYVWQQFFFVPGYYPNADKWWTQFPVNIFLLSVAVFISYYIVERPFLRLKDRFH